MFVSELKEWYDGNKLIINAAKSNVMLVSTSQRDFHTSKRSLDIKFGNDTLEQIHSTNYLCVKLDHNLSCVNSWFTADWSVFFPLIC